MYGIGVRIATYLQVVIIIFGEVYADHTYAAALTSVNLWFLWALIIAMYFSTDTAEWRDIDMLRALGDTMSYMNLGALLLPTAKLDHESVFTRIVRWATLLHWQFTPTEGIRRTPDPNGPECYYDWFFCVSNTAEAGRYPRVIFNHIVTYGTIGLVFLALLRIVIYVEQFPWDRIRVALKGTFGANKHTWLEVCGDILLIYPVGDIMELLDVQCATSYQAGWYHYLKERYSLPPNAFPIHSCSGYSCSESLPVQVMWMALSVPRRIKNHIDGSQARIIWNITFLVYGIQTLEFTILANNIQGVNDLRSLGQLLALIISVGALLAMIAGEITKNRRRVYGVPLFA
ncbi:hypothetical protein BGX38DRAFT_244775 [Terfezia claveryi]|nr:hypothetical protein BGX38DRAFT_244775 [Terfezia claveryi]